MNLCLYARWRFRLSSLLDKEVIAPCRTSVPCQLRPAVRRHGRGVLWTGSDPCMTGRLEGPLASPVFAQSWSTDGAWSSTTALLSGRDRLRCLCVLRLSGSEPKTWRTGAYQPPSRATASPWRALEMWSSTVIHSQCSRVQKYANMPDLV